MVWTLLNLHHLVNYKSVAIFVSDTESSSNRQLFNDIDQLYSDDFTLFVDNFEVIFVNLQHETSVFLTVVADEIVGCIAATDTCADAQLRSCQGLVGVGLELQVVYGKFDLLLAAIQNNEDEFIFSIHDLPSFSTVLGFNNAH